MRKSPLDLGQTARIQAFADDIVILFSAPATYHFSTMCHRPLSKVADWITNNKLTFNNNKSFYTIISSKRYSHIPRIKIGSHNIKYCTHIKYLGIYKTYRGLSKTYRGQNTSTTLIIRSLK
ncbi:hypothetical protein CDAR_57161 [Caerostris darwini]|uniref:Reverse transcriptase domain-containing protein n=1 Tax=Caerostris darwini TaxID=1538125 RepID=A0AAV4WEA6_9ARAC|nr:hypothetical protein CDAR_57161 [Caerostris darwini]